MNDIPAEYEANEEDLDKILNWLRIFDPESANEEEAVKFMVDMRLTAHQYAHTKPEGLEDLYKQFKAKQKPKS